MELLIDKMGVWTHLLLATRDRNQIREKNGLKTFSILFGNIKSKSKEYVTVVL